MDKLRALSIISRIATLKSFSAAGAEIGLSSTSVSRIVSDFEEETGVQIFSRSTRNLHPTEAGQVLIENASELLDQYRMIVDLAQSTAQEPVGSLRITATQSFGTNRLAPVIARFVQAHPKVRVQCSYTNRIVDMIGEGVDIAIRITAPKDSRLVARKIGTVEHIACATPSYLAEHPPLTSPDDLLDHNCIVYQSDRRTDTDWTFYDPVGNKITTRAAGNLTVDTTDAVLQFVQEGSGVGLLPDYAVQDAIDCGSLKRLFPEYAGHKEAINVVFPSKVRQSAAQRLLLTHIYSSFS